MHINYIMDVLDNVLFIPSELKHFLTFNWTSKERKMVCNTQCMQYILMTMAYCIWCTMIKKTNTTATVYVLLGYIGIMQLCNGPYKCLHMLYTHKNSYFVCKLFLAWVFQYLAQLHGCQEMQVTCKNLLTCICT